MHPAPVSGATLTTPDAPPSAAGYSRSAEEGATDHSALIAAEAETHARWRLVKGTPAATPRVRQAWINAKAALVGAV